jgi:2,3-bisphosphoglycerate-independent phosphoglycerate mutase
MFAEQCGGKHLLGGRDRQICEFEASLVYRVSSRTARVTERNPVSEKTKNKKQKKNQQQQQNMTTTTHLDELLSRLSSCLLTLE